MRASLSVILFSVVFSFVVFFMTPAAATPAAQMTGTTGSVALDRHIEELEHLLNRALEQSPGERVMLTRTELEAMQGHVEQIQRLLGVRP